MRTRIPLDLTMASPPARGRVAIVLLAICLATVVADLAAEYARFHLLYQAQRAEKTQEAQEAQRQPPPRPNEGMLIVGPPVALNQFQERAENADTLCRITAVINIMVLIPTAIVFMAWFYSAHKQLNDLGAQGLKYSPGWAVGSFFVPFLNLFRPYRIAQEIWRASNPERIASSADWKNGRRSLLIVSWWLCWIALCVLAPFFFRLSFLDTNIINAKLKLMSLPIFAPVKISYCMSLASNINTSLNQVIDGSLTGIIADAFALVAGLLLIRVIRAITRRQEQREAALRITEAPGFIPANQVAAESSAIEIARYQARIAEPERNQREKRTFRVGALIRSIGVLGVAVVVAMLLWMWRTPPPDPVAAEHVVRQMKFVRVPKGTFWMGWHSIGNWDSIGKQSKQVTIDQDFELAAYCVTQEQWQAVMGNNPSWFSREGVRSPEVASVSDEDLNRFPVEMVAWKDNARGIDVQEFLRKLNEREQGKGWKYRLPKEAEWEYACRGAATSKEECSFDFYFPKPTNDLSRNQANFQSPGGGGRTTKVGQYPPNKLGLYDMHGNVGQWCEGLYDNTRSARVVRGGSWDFGRAAGRFPLRPSDRFDDVGFRVARVPSGN
jgi:formylglycine-generating enzyme required for sulfatase activity